MPISYCAPALLSTRPTHPEQEEYPHPIAHRTALLDLLATLSFRLGDFTLASGQKSDYYIDCRTTTLHAEGGRLAGLVLYDLIRDTSPTP